MALRLHGVCGHTDDRRVGVAHALVAADRAVCEPRCRTGARLARTRRFQLITYAKNDLVAAFFLINGINARTLAGPPVAKFPCVADDAFLGLGTAPIEGDGLSYFDSGRVW